ncbi:MAG: DUF423 domain-containing protein [Rhodospirillales bacterium]|nr:DUF423 domain-containing protein [Rhodospirillales bacterium]
MNARNPWLVVAALSGLIAVVAGAHGAHGLDGPKNQVDGFNIGVQYHMWHSLALIGVAWLAEARKGMAAARYANVSGWLFVAGIVFFSGSLYFYGITGNVPFSGSAPIGGYAQIGGWAVLAFAATRRN